MPKLVLAAVLAGEVVLVVVLTLLLGWPALVIGLVVVVTTTVPLVLWTVLRHARPAFAAAAAGPRYRAWDGGVVFGGDDGYRATTSWDAPSGNPTDYGPSGSDSGWSDSGWSSSDCGSSSSDSGSSSAGSSSDSGGSCSSSD